METVGALAAIIVAILLSFGCWVLLIATVIQAASASCRRRLLPSTV